MPIYLPESYVLDEPFGAKLASAPKAIRKAVWDELARSEFARCAADPIYWLDTSRHPACPKPPPPVSGPNGT